MLLTISTSKEQNGLIFKNPETFLSARLHQFSTPSATQTELFFMAALVRVQLVQGEFD